MERTSKIAILDDYQNVVKTLKCFDMIKDQDVVVLNETYKDPEILAEKIKDAEILVLIRERTVINEELLSRLPNVKLISQTGKISNHLELSDCTRFGVAVAEGTGSPVAPAELAWVLIMDTVRQIPQAIEAMKQGKWQTNIGETISGKTIGIWGYGKIGKKIAQYAKAFGASVLVWGSEASRENAVNDGFEKAETKEDFFRNADVVTLHLRLNDETFGIVKESDLELMKPTAALINTARAELVEKNALINALKKGTPGFAGVDVYEEEPVYNENFELLKMNNVVCTPHLGYVERNGYELYFEKAFENVVQFIKGSPTHIANPEVL
ncbi:D-3-phosphoglycerate dehydrogenase [Chryseobacterium sp. 52]|uniref:D-2-hydroxyacid dehydrogenase family protein n=1 Tax=Chryseobacterium sp. 52 TaxID=2035213 RepID=UPI000C179155|nr:D-2-hydroxyacid dehydrogenase family protein [Chryseobacterium sp. 52]PIF45178.1 D-3-phosphoglycerate dehydrogenase [Chryseobacterium sp. 52]